jgi:hypothetical protein
MAVKMHNPLHVFDSVNRWTNLYKLEQKHVTNGFLKKGDQVLKQKEKEYSEAAVQPDQVDDIVINSPQVFIDQLFKMRGAFTTDEIRGEVNTMIATVIN